ncbi:LAFE_0B01002g1_1 [Lachancea fermentati]|uniref:LAFE_0B01002g1_1 n=1 Tax=Lachancea fermentati TaxID=4955 RepID=A0A1G4M7K4_LACFM|nr:LAFE_0B01002g1_1 [Lachancea fermentati]
MAGKSSKKQAQNNLGVLRRLYVAVVPLVALSLLRLVLRRGSWLAFAVLHGPLAACVYTLEKSGRPRFDARGRVEREGMDLRQSGLTEWLFDVVYLSLFADAGHVVFGTLKFYYVLGAVPVYVAYKARALAQPVLARLGGGRSRAAEMETEIGDGGAKSRRQAKRERNADKPRMRYR